MTAVTEMSKKMAAVVAAAGVPVTSKPTNVRYDCAYCDGIYTEREKVTLCAHCNEVVCNKCHNVNSDLVDTCGDCGAELCERCSVSLSCASCGQDCCKECAVEDQCPECSDDKLLCEDCSGSSFCNDCEVPLCNEHVATFDNPNDDSDDDASSSIKLCKECAEKRKVKPEDKRNVSYCSEQQMKKQKMTKPSDDDDGDE